MSHRVRPVLTAVAIVVSVVLATVGSSDTAQAAAATGTLAVVVTDSVGAPLSNVSVTATSDGTTWLWFGGTRTPGTYQLSATPGSYRIRITAAGGAIVDYVPGSPTIDGAATFTVVAGQTTTINEQLTQSGNVQVSLVDRVTGQPVADGCVTITGYSPTTPICNHPDGRYLFVAVALGSQTITVSQTWSHWASDPVRVTVASGFADVPVRLDPAAAIQATVQASDDPSIHPNFCVFPVYPSEVSVQLHCVDTVTGSVLIGPLPASSVQLFAFPQDTGGAYGAQWVGAHGGTGDQREAQWVQTTIGTVTSIPPIQVDHAGSIRGTVTGPPNGLSNAEYYAQPFGLEPGLGFGWGGVGFTAVAQVGGGYALSGLGPYAWPVEFSSRDGYAYQWSGNAPNRYAATPVQVHAGQISVLNATLAPGIGITGYFYAKPPTTSDQGWVYAINAVTGDEAGFSLVGGNIFWLSGLNSDPVRLRYELVSPGDGSVYEYPFTMTPGGPLTNGVVLRSANPLLTAPAPDRRNGQQGPVAAGAPVPSRSRKSPWPPAPGASSSPTIAAPAAPSLATPPGVPSYLADATAPRRRSAKHWFF